LNSESLKNKLKSFTDKIITAITTQTAIRFSKTSDQTEENKYQIRFWMSTKNKQGKIFSSIYTNGSLERDSLSNMNKNYMSMEKQLRGCWKHVSLT
jgi:hypothetical protein